MAADAPAPKPHEHVDGGVCKTYFYARAEQADELRQVAADAHRQARHGGRWDFCADQVCAALERWLHEEAKGSAPQWSPKPADLARMVAG